MFESLKDSIGFFITKMRVGFWVRKHGRSFRNLMHYHSITSEEVIRHADFEEGVVRFDEDAYQKLLKIIPYGTKLDVWECQEKRADILRWNHLKATPCVCIPSRFYSDSLKDHCKWNECDRRHFLVPLYYHTNKQ